MRILEIMVCLKGGCEVCALLLPLFQLKFR